MDRDWDLSEIAVQRVVPEAILPKRAHPGDAGLDLHILEAVTIAPGAGAKLRTGLAFAIPDGYVGLVTDRSSMALRGLKTAGGIIDSGYRGEVQVILWNLSGEPRHLAAGDRIAQLLLVAIATPPVRESTDLGQTGRGTGGFGSSGR